MKFFSTRRCGLAAVAILGGLILSHHAANATIIVDGSYDSDYGSPGVTVGFNPAAPTSNFSTPTNESNSIGYTIYLTSQGGNVFGFLQAAGPGSSIGSFANVYFDLDPANGNGSDLGFELGPLNHANAFIPGVAGNALQSNITTAVSTDGLGFEFEIPNVDFTTAIGGLNYYAGHTLPGLGDQIILRLSQSFGYSVAGGDSYGADRLGAVTLAAAAPELSTWAMMLLGFGFLGFITYRRSNKATAVAIA